MRHVTASSPFIRHTNFVIFHFHVLYQGHFSRGNPCVGLLVYFGFTAGLRNLTVWEVTMIRNGETLIRVESFFPLKHLKSQIIRTIFHKSIGGECWPEVQRSHAFFFFLFPIYAVQYDVTIYIEHYFAAKINTNNENVFKSISISRKNTKFRRGPTSLSPQRGTFNPTLFAYVRINIVGNNGRDKKQKKNSRQPRWLFCTFFFHMEIVNKNN